MEDMRQLSEEINRLLLSPYRVSFKKLFALINKIDPYALQIWARGSPCQIHGLAALILDGFEVEPLSLDIVRLFSCVLPFRDALLELKPILLDTLLNNATTSESGYHKYAATCTALLSAPLNVPEPATLPAFLTKLLDQAVQVASVDSVRFIYEVFSGLTLDWLDNLPIDLVTRLQDQLVNILRAPGIGNESPNLMCLAVLAKLASVDSTVYGSDQTSISTNLSSPLDPSSGTYIPARKKRDTYSHARQFFTAKRSGKTLDLVMLKVILACSRNGTLTVSEAVESLKCAEEIVDEMGSNEKKTWLLKNGPRVKKLYEKVLRQDIAAVVQCAAFNFIATMIEAEILPPELMVTFRGLLHASVPLKLMQKAIEKYITQFDESIICKIVCSLLELACLEAAPSSESLARLENSVVLTSCITTRLENSSALRQAILHSLSMNEVSGPLDRFLRVKYPLSITVPHENLGNCPHSYHQTKLDLHRKTCNMFLKAALHASQDEVSIDASTATALLNKQMHQSSSSTKCDFYNPQSLASAVTHWSRQDVRGCLSEGLGSHGWRNNLREHMAKATQYQHQSIVTMVEDICQDLEFRCENSEHPLRDEQSRSKDLEQKLKVSEDRAVELKRQVQERIQLLDGLELARTRLEEQVQVAEQQIKSQLSSHELLQQELDQTKQNADHAAETAQEEIKRQELAHLAVMIGKEELFEKRTSALVGLESHTKRLADELAQMRDQEEKAIFRINALEALNCEITKTLETAQQLADSRGREIDRLVDLEATSSTEKYELTSKLEVLGEQCKLLRAELHTTTAALTNELADMQRLHEERLSVKSEEAKLQKASYENTVHKLRERLFDAENTAILAAKQSTRSIESLEKDIVMLRQVQEQRANEFAEAQELSSKLMAVMGMMRPQPNPPFQNATAKQPSNSQVGHLPCAPNDSTNTPQFLGPASSITNWPTPKRTKINRNVKSPVTVVAKATNQKSGRHSTMKERRIPLGNLDDALHNMKDLSPNPPLHREQSQKLRSEYVQKENRDIEHNMSFGNLSFSDSEVFTSTSQQHHKGKNDHAVMETVDDTTIDF